MKHVLLGFAIFSSIVPGASAATSYQCSGNDQDSGKEIKFTVTKNDTTKELVGVASDFGVKVEGRYNSAENSTTGMNFFGIVSWHITLELTETPSGVTADFGVSQAFDVEDAVCASNSETSGVTK